MSARRTLVRGLRATLVAALLAALLVALAGAGRAEAAEKAIWGPAKLPSGASAFPLYREANVDTFQVILDWSRTARSRPSDPKNPNDPAYRWLSSIDSLIREANASGISVALLVTRSPAWANGGRGPIWVPHAGEFGNFLAAASRRYPSVRKWMIWGEPNRADRFQPNQEGGPASARAYAPILDSAYGALKSVSRRNIVIGGMTWTGGDVKPEPFLRFLRLPSGQPPRLDWYGHNPFPFRFPDLTSAVIGGGWRDISDLDVFSREVARVYAQRCPRRRKTCPPRLWLSEFNIQSDKPSVVFRDFVSKPEQARWLTAAYRIANDLPVIAGLGWFSLLDQPSGPTASNWGLLTATGGRKPAFFAFRRAPSRRLRPAVRVAGRIKRRTLIRRGLRIRVRPRTSGRVRVRLLRRNRTVKRVSRRGRAGRRVRLRLKPRRARRGRYVVLVTAPRGEPVRRNLRVR